MCNGVDYVIFINIAQEFDGSDFEVLQLISSGIAGLSRPLNFLTICPTLINSLSRLCTFSI